MKPEDDFISSNLFARSRADDDSSDASDSEDEVKYGDVKVSVKDCLSKVLRDIHSGDLDLKDKAKLDSLGPDLAGRTGDRDQPTALHIMAKKRKEELPALDEKMEPLIKYLCKQSGYLEIRDGSNHTSLFLAIEKKKEKMVQWMCDAHPNIGNIISIPGAKDRNCLHIGIHKKVSFLDLLIDKANSEAFAAKDYNGNTPLHLAVDYKCCKRKQLEYVQRLLEKGDPAISARPNGDFNKNNLSPYLHHKATVAKNTAPKKPDGTGNLGAGIESAPVRGTTTSAVEIHSHTSSSRPDMPSNSQADPRIKYGASTSIQTSTPVPSLSPNPAPDTASTAKITVAVEPSSSGQNNSKGGKKSEPVDESIVRNIGRLLKLHYLRSRQYPDALEILYGKDTTTNKEFNFDLSGGTDSVGMLTQRTLKDLGKLDFEDALQYVFIPRLTVEPSRRKTPKTTPLQDGAGRCDFTHIFNLLHSKGVETILRVIVDDSDPTLPPHSDEAIEASLKGRGVEIWDWRKTDLCTEVIFNAAPGVRKVHLYWSGNNAVLRGWSELEGLPKLSKLQEMHLHIQQGLESYARTKQNAEVFVTRMKTIRPQVKVNLVEPDIRQARSQNSNPREEVEENNTPRHEWIECMESFRGLLLNAERNFQGVQLKEYIEEPITVALLDDGVTVGNLDYHFIGGKSFCVRSEDQGLLDPHYRSRTGHGTLMAQKIQLMCPHVKFLVLRLEDCPSPEGTKLNLTIRSVVKAIREATRRRVHIISMSWSIEAPKDDTEKLDLQNAINDAAKANILMFCSAKDRGPNDAATFPSTANNNIFIIGAANTMGTKADYVGNPNNITYTFPGDKVAVGRGPNEIGPQKTVDGSSVATALAAGLAALILYCIQVRIFTATGTEKNRVREVFRKVKNHDGMKRAFNAIDTTEESGRKFLKVWEVFGELCDLKDKKDPGVWLELVADVEKRLCSKIF